jgi:hypothetical protein
VMDDLPKGRGSGTARAIDGGHITVLENSYMLGSPQKWSGKRVVESVSKVSASPPVLPSRNLGPPVAPRFAPSLRQSARFCEEIY